MQGKANWFGKRGFSFTAPTTWRGWMYLAFWGVAIGGPALMLVGIARWPESLIWLTASGFAFLHDVRRMRREHQASQVVEEVFVIDDVRDVTNLARR